MSALDSPLEALAFNYLTYGFQTAVNSIWAWLAVVTAALSFWSIRALSSPPLSTTEPRGRREVSASASSAPPPNVAETEAEKPAAVVCSSFDESETQLLCSPSKTKFSLYYEEDEYVEDGDGDGVDAAAVSEKLGGWCVDDWERTMTVRMEDMGWYRWQDTEVLDGSVVRLWEGCRRRRAAALVVDGGGEW